jgi:hypothetical protein
MSTRHRRGEEHEGCGISDSRAKVRKRSIRQELFLKDFDPSREFVELILHFLKFSLLTPSRPVLKDVERDEPLRKLHLTKSSTARFEAVPKTDCISLNPKIGARGFEPPAPGPEPRAPAGLSQYGRNKLSAKQLVSDGLMRPKYGVVRAALLQAAADAFDLDHEPAITQALFEFAIFAGGPYGQDSAGLEGGVDNS